MVILDRRKAVHVGSPKDDGVLLTSVVDGRAQQRRMVFHEVVGLSPGGEMRSDSSNRSLLLFIKSKEMRYSSGRATGR